MGMVDNMQGSSHGMMPPGLVVGNANAMGMQRMADGMTSSSTSQGGAGMMAQQYAPQQQQYFVSPAGMSGMAAMPYCQTYPPTGMSGMVYAPPGAGMYQPTNLYQAPQQYAPQPQQYVPQPQQYVPQPQQTFISTQSHARNLRSGSHGNAGYAYQQPQAGSSGYQPMAQPGSGMGAPPGYSSHAGPGVGGYGGGYDTGGYDDNAQAGQHTFAGNNFGGGAHSGYYRSS